MNNSKKITQMVNRIPLQSGISAIKRHPKLLLSLLLLLIVAGVSRLFIYSSTEPVFDAEFQSIFNESYKIFALNIPEKLDFAGETIPLHRFDVRESLDRELLVNTYWQSNTLLFIKKSNKWLPVIEPILEKNNVPDDFKYLALIESGLSNVVSPSGAAGFWQFMSSAGKEYGLEISNEVDERYHLEKATEAACRYLNNAKSSLGSWTLAAAAYNAGIDGIIKQIQKQKTDNYYDLALNDETARYVFRIIAAKEILQHSQKYGFHYRDKDLYEPLKIREVTVDSGITDLSNFALANKTSYKMLKLFNPWLRENSLTNKTGKKYILKFPSDSYGFFFPDSIPVHSGDSL